jgi:hypothetical protein
MLSELTESGKFRIHWLIGHLAPTLIVNRITGQHYRVIAEDAPPSGLPPSPLRMRQRVGRASTCKRSTEPMTGLGKLTVHDTKTRPSVSLSSRFSWMTCRLSPPGIPSIRNRSSDINHGSQDRNTPPQDRGWDIWLQRPTRYGRLGWQPDKHVSDYAKPLYKRKASSVGVEPATNLGSCVV